MTSIAFLYGMGSMVCAVWVKWDDGLKMWPNHAWTTQIGGLPIKSTTSGSRTPFVEFWCTTYTYSVYQLCMACLVFFKEYGWVYGGGFYRKAACLWRPQGGFGPHLQLTTPLHSYSADHQTHTIQERYRRPLMNSEQFMKVRVTTWPHDRADHLLLKTSILAL
jgi:hypothetical protein